MEVEVVTGGPSAGPGVTGTVQYSALMDKRQYRVVQRGLMAVESPRRLRC